MRLAPELIGMIRKVAVAGLADNCVGKTVEQPLEIVLFNLDQVPVIPRLEE